MALCSSLERLDLPRIIGHFPVASLDLTPERTLSLGDLGRPGLTKIVRYSPLARLQKLTYEGSQELPSRCFETLRTTPRKAKHGQTSHNPSVYGYRSTRIICLGQDVAASTAGIRNRPKTSYDKICQREGCKQRAQRRNSAPNEKNRDFIGREPTHQTACDNDACDMDTGIECICCFCLFAVKDLRQCTNGHLVCAACLNCYAKEAAYGTGKTALECMVRNCSAIYPRIELERCVEPAVFKKLEERLQEENINRANLDNLARCPKCNYAAIVPSNVKKFSCLRESCRQTSCLLCGRRWEQRHLSRCPATQVVRGSDQAERVRKEYEEKMTAARVRVCPACRTPFTKDGGCNRIVCRCGTSVCYLCRTSDIDFTHFCSHLQYRGMPCAECNKCSLWADAEEIDNRVIERYQREVQVMLHV